MPVRKGEGLFPGRKTEREAAPDYRGPRHRLRIQRSSVRAGDRVLLVDDWIETGQQTAAVRDMVAECGGEQAGSSVIVDQLPAERRDAVGQVRALLDRADLPQ